MADIPIHHFVTTAQDGKKFVKSTISFYIMSEAKDDNHIDGIKKSHIEKMINIMRSCKLKEVDENSTPENL